MDEENESTINQATEITEEEKELLEAKKKKIRLQISELEELIEEITHELEVVKFGDLDIDPSAVVTPLPSTSENININDKLQLDLFKLSGFWCSKCTDTELVYKFCSTSNYENAHAVQLLLMNDEKIKVGKWALPWGIKIEYVLRETPLDKISHTSSFLRNCKRHIDCHEQRKIQIEDLRKLTEEVKNIRVEGSLGNLSMYIKLLSINNSELNVKHDMMICLFYESGEARPHLIKTNWSLNEKPDENTILEMSKFAKDFKKFNLQEAYEIIANKDHQIFKWKPDQGENSTNINLGFESSTEEESEEELPKRKRKQSKKRVVKKKKELEKSQESKENDSLEDSENDENTPDKNNSKSKSKSIKPTVTKSKVKPPAKKTAKKSVKITGKSPGSKKNQVDKRQTRLSFKGVPLDASDVQETPRRQEFQQRMRETSTPKNKLTDKIPLVSLVPISVSPIESDSSVNKDLDKSKKKNSNSLK